MAGFKVRTDQEDKFGICMVRRRPVISIPEVVTETSASRTDICVAVVSVNTP